MLEFKVEEMEYIGNPEVSDNVNMSMEVIKLTLDGELYPVTNYITCKREGVLVELVGINIIKNDVTIIQTVTEKLTQSEYKELITFILMMNRTMRFRMNVKSKLYLAYKNHPKTVVEPRLVNSSFKKMVSRDFETFKLENTPSNARLLTLGCLHIIGMHTIINIKKIDMGVSISPHTKTLSLNVMGRVLSSIYQSDDKYVSINKSFGFNSQEINDLDTGFVTYETNKDYIKLTRNSIA